MIFYILVAIYLLNNMKNTVLMVMSVRNYRQVFESYDKLDCEKVYFKGFHEDELVTHINNFIEKSNFENYFLTSDDCMISKEKFDLLKYYLNFNPIVSGWGIWGQHSETTTIISEEKINNYNPLFSKHSHSFLIDNSYKTYEIDRLPKFINSGFTGWFFTGAKKNIWLEYPFQTYTYYTGWRSDFNFSYRILKEKKYNQVIIKSCRSIHLSSRVMPQNHNFNNKEIIKTF